MHTHVRPRVGCDSFAAGRNALSSCAHQLSTSHSLCPTCWLPAQASYQQLSYKLMSLFRECFSMHTFPELTKKLAKFEPAVHNPAAQLLLKRGRK